MGLIFSLFSYTKRILGFEDADDTIERSSSKGNLLKSKAVQKAGFAFLPFRSVC